MIERLDELDRKILKHICSGVYSYSQLEKLCDAGRNTVYRRIDRLEKKGIISRKILAFPDYTKLNLSAVVIGLNVKNEDLDKTSEFLKDLNHVKFLWKTYGTHDILLILVCDRGEVGDTIYELKQALVKIGIQPLRFDASTSITWEKIDLSPL
jgi:DNA-binding Lrp family transcriptional regulator